MSDIDIDLLIQELIEAQGNLCAQNNKQSSLFVLARLIPNMDEDAWSKLCAKTPSMGWYAFEVNSELGPVPSMPAKPNTNLGADISDNLLKATFIQHLELEVARSIRANTALALIHFAQSSKKSLKEATQILQKAVLRFGDSCDIVGAISKERFALIMPGAKIFKAQNLVEDMLKFCAHEGLLLKAGIAGQIGKDCDSLSLFEQAAIALQEAKTHTQDVRVYKEVNTTVDATLVQSHEKRFLFGG